MSMVKKIIAFCLPLAVMCAVLPVHTADSAASVRGDVNGDGKFSVADLVSLQNFLLAAPDSPADLSAGDLCHDGRLDTFDLVVMRQLLLPSPAEPLDRLKGMDYRSAAAEGLISKSEYNYQITGELKRSVEEKMARPLDYSIDRFYLVNNDALELDNTRKFLYNSATEDVYPIVEETKINCATWYWKGSKAALYGLDDDPEKQNEFLDALEFYNITEIYYSISPNNLVKKKDIVAPFVKNAYARDMRVYLLGGERDWLYEDSYEVSIFNAFNKVEEYNSLVDTDSRIAGVSYDAEVWNNSEYNWKKNNEARCQQIKYVETAQDYADSKNLAVSFCLPYWITRYYYTDANGITRNMYDGITAIANDTILMVYRDTPAAILKLVDQTMTDADNTSLYYAEKNDCNLEIAVETNYTDEGAHVSFYEEETAAPGCVRDALAEVQSALSEYKYRTTFAIHHAVVLYEYYLSKEET